MRGLAGEVAIVTGAASGIGRAIALRLASEGVRVGVLDRDSAGAEATCAEARAFGADMARVCVDVTDYAATKAALATLEGAMGAPSILVNAVGGGGMAPFLETSPADWQGLIALNLTSALNLQHLVCPGMVAHGRGRIISIASDAARVGASQTAVYSAAKGGLIAFSKSLARELARAQVLVNVVCPGPTDTPLFAGLAGPSLEHWRAQVTASIPLKRIGQPTDIAGLVAFLASADADYITGQVFSVSGGLTMAG